MNIEISGIDKRFGSLQALYPLSLTIPDGEFISLLGPSGCGKTTMLRMIAGLETPDHGEIKFGDEVIFSKDEKIEVSPQKRNIGMVFQDFALWPHMTVFDNVAYSLRARGLHKNIKPKVMQALKNVQLEGYEERYPHQLSGGQQQRVAFARAIANNPPIILLDEPLSALDAALRDDMRVLLQSLVKKLGITTIYVTHDQGEAMAMSDRIVVMNQGKVMQFATPETIYHQPANEVVASFVGRGGLVKGTYDVRDGQAFLAITNSNTKLPIASVANVNGGQKVTAMIRPEQITLSNTPFEGQVAANVEHASYLGERYELVLRLKNSNHTLLAYATTRMAIGEEVYCKINQDIHIIQIKGEITNETA